MARRGLPRVCIMLVCVILAAGFGLLALGSETVLRGAIGLAKVLGLSPLLIGLVIVSVGMSLPQLFVALEAAGRSAPDIAVGSVVGSNIFNLLSLLGLAALIRPVPAPPKIVFRDGGAMLLASLALVPIAASGTVSARIGMGLLIGLVLYLALSFATDWRRPIPLSFAESRANARKNVPRFETSTFLVIFGIVCLYFGGRFAVDGSIAAARMFRLPGFEVALTIVAAGTALPALFAVLAASARGLNVVAGQLLVANVLNILLVVGLTAWVRPLPLPDAISQLDIYVVAGSAGLVVAMMMPGWRITRPQGALLLLCYAAYLGLQALRAGLVRF